MARLVQQGLFDWPEDPDAADQTTRDQPKRNTDRIDRNLPDRFGSDSVPAARKDPPEDTPHTKAFGADQPVRGRQGRRNDGTRRSTARPIDDDGHRDDDSHQTLGSGGRGTDREQRLERFLTEKMPQGQGQSPSAARQVRIDQEYGTDLFARLSEYSDSMAYSDSTGRSARPGRLMASGRTLSQGLPAHTRPRRHARRSRSEPSGTQASSILFETGQEARWQILPGALRFALAVYGSDFAFSRGFWSRLQELLDRHDVCLAPDCRPLIEGTGLLDTSGDGVFGTAPVRVDTPADPQVPTAEAKMRTQRSPQTTVVGLMRFMRETGGF